MRGNVVGSVTAGSPASAGLARTWVQAVRSPWLALVSGLGSGYAIGEMLLVATGRWETATALGAFLLVFAPATLIATLPDTTVLWRVASLGVGLHFGPIVYAPMDGLSFGAFLDSWATAISGDGTGVLYMFVAAAVALPALELTGAVLRRGALQVEAERYRARPPLSILGPRRSTRGG